MSSQGNGSASGPNGLAIDPSIALKANDLDSVSAHVKKINELASTVSPTDNVARLELAEAARKLVRDLETPRETMIKHCWAQTANMAAITTGIEVGIFEELAKNNGSPKKVTDLAKATGVDPVLVARLLRHVGAMGYIEETDVDEYKATNFAKALTIPIIKAGYPVLAGGLLGATYKLHEFVKLNGLKTPTDMSNGALQYAYNTKLNMFEYLHSKPPYGDLFNLHMGGYSQGRASWMDKGFFPVEENLIKGADRSDGSVLLVDIGGSLGHDIEEFLHKYPSAPGRLVLQDLNSVLSKIEKLDPKIERQEFNFFEQDQPVVGSRAYYMHSVLHDWPDDAALKILGRITPSMKKGYSKLLINENDIPLRHANYEATGLDIHMMALLAAKERTEGDWQSLLGAAGLKINKIWTIQNGVESLIEAELA